MGNFRSRSGCATCKQRRVKCDETRPNCDACRRRGRTCSWDTETRFREYQPGSSTSHSIATGSFRTVDVGTLMRMEDGEGGESSKAGRPFSPGERQTPSQIAILREAHFTTTQSSCEQSPTSQFLNEPVVLTQYEALLVRHYTEHLGRWLDCTDATRQFTLGVPEELKHCQILCHAVLCFAARHRGDDDTAEVSYQRCLPLLIARLHEENASQDETLVCAIVILRFYEQLNVPFNGGLDEEQHLAGTKAILKASQGHSFLNPTAPTLREAAFWVYVRQCLYNSTINQQPPDIDFSLQLHPVPGSVENSHSLALETAWANQITWNLACVVNFCFDADEPTGGRSEPTQRLQRWQKLWDEVQQWCQDRPDTFSPIWQGESSLEFPFPEVWFTADWHVLSFGFYHLACILLLTYKSGPKVPIRSSNSLSNVELQILNHARCICGASKCSPGTVPLSIVVCHTIFIWASLITSQREQDGVIELLVALEDTHSWPTRWIVTTLQQQWSHEHLEMEVSQ